MGEHLKGVLEQMLKESPASREPGTPPIFSGHLPEAKAREVCLGMEAVGGPSAVAAGAVLTPSVDI